MRIPATAVVLTALLILTLVTVTGAQSENEDLVWRRIVVPDLSTVGSLADVASDGISVVIATKTSNRKGDRAHVWFSPNGRTGWNPVEQSPVRFSGIANIAHGPDGYVMTGPVPGWESTDGSEWSATMATPAVTVAQLVSTPDGLIAAGTAIDTSNRSTNAALVRAGPGGTWTEPNYLTGLDTGDASALITGLVSGEDGGMLAAVTSGTPAEGFESEIWRSVDGQAWDPVEVTGEDLPPLMVLTRVGDHVLGLTSDGVMTAPADGSTWATVPELAQAHVIIRHGPGGLAVGDGVVATSPDGATWAESPDPIFDNAVVRSAVALDDGSVVAVGSARSYQKQRIPAIWIGEPADKVGSASMEESATHFSTIGTAFEAEQGRLDDRTLRTMAQARDFARDALASTERMREGMASLQWAPEASGVMASLLAVYDAQVDLRDQQARAKNVKQWNKVLKKWRRLGPANVSAAIVVRETLDLPVGPRLKKAQRAIDR